LKDKLKRLVHIIQLNTSICRRLQTFYARVSTNLDPGSAGAASLQDITLDNCIFQLETHTARLQSMITRSEGIGSMVAPHLQIYTRTTQLISNAPRLNMY
jgi:hypothetical protein